MPIQMTAAQYQAKYGQAPALPNAKTSPIKMTQTQYDAKYKNILPTQPKPGPVKNLFQTVGNVAGKVGNALTSSEQTFGKGISTVFDKNTQNTVNDISSQESQGQQNLLTAINKESDPTKKQTMIDFLKKNYGTDYKAPTATDINPAFGLSNKDVIGAAVGTGLDILSAGSYGEAAKGAETGKILTSSDKIANLVGKVGLDSTIKETTEQGAKTVAKQTAKQLFTKSAEGAAQGYGYDVSQNLQNGKTGASILKPGVGTAAGLVTPFATKLIGSLAKGITGKLTGAGTDVIDRAIKNPEAVQDAIKQYAKNPDQKMELVNQASEALSDLSKQKNEEYASQISNLKATKPIPKGIVTDTFTTAVKKFGGRIDENGELTFKNSALTNTDKTNLTNAWNDIKGWTDVTPQGMDTLRQNLGNNMKDFKVTGNPRANVILGAVKTALTNTMKDSIPGYDKILSQYGDKAETISDMAKEFQLAGQAKDTTKLNNILKLFKKDPSAMTNLVKVMGEEGANDFQNQVSGAILSNWINPSKLTDTGIAGAAFELATHSQPAAAAATLAASSPRVVGTAATTAGSLLNTGAGTGARRLFTKIAGQNSP